MGRRKLVSDGRVLECALAILADGGGERFTLVRVAEATGVAASTIIQRFRSRTELLVAAFAYANAKRLLNRSLSASLADQLTAEAASFGRCSATGDFAEGVTAFIEKRKPSFKGN